MKKVMGWAVLAAILALPAMAQDEAAPAADASAPAEEAAPAADEAAAAPAEEAAAPAEDASAASSSEDTSAAAAVTGGDTAAPEDTSTVSTDDSSSSDGGTGTGRTLYVGVEYDMTKIDINDSETREALGRRRFESSFYKLRLGARIFEGVGLEVHAGFPDANASSRKLETKQFYGVYLVPTGVLFDLVEISARLGYAYIELESELGKDDADGASFGLAFEVPLRLLGEGMPNLRLGAGGTVYQEERDGRVFGFHGGIRYDFTL